MTKEFNILNSNGKGISLILILLCYIQANSQVYLSKFNTITFFSEAPIENIEAKSEKVVSMINLNTGEIKSYVQISTFKFEKSLMQKHFNEQYMESDKYPSASFKGKFIDLKKLKSHENGKYKIVGKITIHGVTRVLENDVTLTWTDNGITGKTVFLIKLDDHNIKIPSIVVKNIAEIVEVRVVLNFKN